MSTHRHSITKQYLVAIISLYLLYNIPIYSKEPIKIIGFLASSFNVAFFASPLTQIRIVLKTKNAESLPFLLILVSFISSLLWFYYGLLINDVFIKVRFLINLIYWTSLNLLTYFGLSFLDTQFIGHFYSWIWTRSVFGLLQKSFESNCKFLASFFYLSSF